MSKIEEKKKHKKDLLFNKSFELFTTKGFSKTSISDIVSNAGVAKGTFYLYFKDKYDIRNKLIAQKGQDICEKAYNEVQARDDINSLEDGVIAFTDSVINQFSKDTIMLKFIAKNLNYGIIHTAIVDESITNKSGFNIAKLYQEVKEKSDVKFKSPEVMMYMIIEMVSGTCYSSILENEPVPIDELKPQLFDSIRAIMETQKIH
ncbi:MAG: TetR/AcrR family transcriptional regulator [Lachnospiraceae bacterium]|nr:TetR/AcrR family transcriptional regulator [Lachnospiraceae bacterium]